MPPGQRLRPSDGSAGDGSAGGVENHRRPGHHGGDCSAVLATSIPVMSRVLTNTPVQIRPVFQKK